MLASMCMLTILNTSIEQKIQVEPISQTSFPTAQIKDRFPIFLGLSFGKSNKEMLI